MQTLKKSEVLHMLPMNREVNGAHVSKLVESIQKMGCIRPVIVVEISFIDGIMRKYVLEGQHLLNALLRLNRPVPYVVIPITNEEDLIEKMALLNASSKSWQLQDFMHAWAPIRPDFVKLTTYFKRYDVELSVLVSILMESGVPTASGGSACLKHIRKGTVKIVNEKKAVVILNAIDDIFTVIKRLDRQGNKYVCAEFVRIYRLNQGKYNHKKFMKNLVKNKDQFLLATHEEEALSTMFRKLI